MRKPYEDVRRAIDARIVVIPIRAVHICAERALRSVGNGVRKYRRRRAWDQVEEALKVPVVRQREIRQLVRTKLRMSIRLIGLQRRSGSGYGDVLSLRADLHLHVDSGDGVNGGGHTSRRYCTESSSGYMDFVNAWQNVADSIASGSVGRDVASFAGLRVNGFDLSLGDHRAALVGHGSHHRAIKNLSASDW